MSGKDIYGSTGRGYQVWSLIMAIMSLLCSFSGCMGLLPGVGFIYVIIICANSIIFGMISRSLGNKAIQTRGEKSNAVKTAQVITIIAIVSMIISLVLGILGTFGCSILNAVIQSQ